MTDKKYKKSGCAYLVGNIILWSTIILGIVLKEYVPTILIFLMYIAQTCFKVADEYKQEGK